MLRKTNETRSESQDEKRKAHRYRDAVKSRVIPASQDEWAEVLATADRYY